MNKASVAAIVPCHNDGERIAPVLETLIACEDISEVIVVDDGSREPMDRLHERFPSIKFIRLGKNLGKAAAMQTGVNATEAKFIFFSDADLVGLKPEHVSEMIQPVTNGTYRMFIGLRDNPEQRAVFLFALNSGERCLHKEDWDALPNFYKKGFRVETGLNFFIKKHGGRLGYKVFPYRNTVREKKYGFWKGFKTRVILSYEVFCTWIYIVCFDFWR